MKLSTTTKTLADALSKLQPVFNTKTALPVLRMVHLRAVDGMLHLSANNLEITMETSIEADTKEPGECVASGARLLLAAKTVVGESILLDARDGFLRAASGKQLSQMGALPISELQATHALNELVATVEMKDVGAIFARNLPFMSTEEVKYVLCGQCVELSVSDAKLNVIATDGRRLIVRTSDYPDEPVNLSAIIPHNACGILAKMQGDAMCAFYSNAVEIINGDDRVVSKLIAGTYAPWRLVIPSESSGVTFVREDMKRAVEVASTVGADGHTINVKLDIKKDSIHVSARRGGENGEETASDEVPAKVDIELMKIAFDGSYLLDALNSIDADDVTMQLTSPMDPCRIDHGEVTTVLMPMRIA